MSEYAVTVEDAMARLAVIPDYDHGEGPVPSVHTFLQAGNILVGAHWTVEHLREQMEAHGVEGSGPDATAAGHGLVVVRPDPLGPLFIATVPEDPDERR